ncbi:GTP-binding protein [Aequorivita viscosa]|uniref:Large ribosomal subunit assembly factor BipA n=2 Tax=Aequorivita viscosa TaxID=797419 RepID=A0A1M6IH69_9FLAO|nr:GTP-binding protein [Aequorivita viscosa]SHJ33779.1 GTP-binding protein [Aequorivita viscosa]
MTTFVSNPLRNTTFAPSKKRREFMKIKNIAIIAHVDHGKTTLVDKIMHHCSLFRENEQSGELILDNNDLERERGITITSKNVSVQYKGTKINIIDTPGHADFGGEVERVLNMADGVLLLVDAFEGPMPQTRFVLQKAIDLGLKPCVVVNKVDKENCTPDEVHESIFDLMFELGAEEWQLDFPAVYGSAKQNWMSTDWRKPTDSIEPLLDMVLEHIPSFKVEEGSLQMLITSLDFSSFTGRIAIGRLQRGVLKEGLQVALVKRDGTIVKTKIKEIHTFEGMGRKKVTEVQPGDICALVGLEGFEIGDTIADLENPEALQTISIDEPTMSMLFTINDSPFFGKDGKFVTSRHIKERLEKELEKNLALRMHPTDSADKFMVFGRGVLHLSVLIETMRREGYELQIGQPQVIIKEVDGVKCEPVEEMTIDLPETVSGTAINMVTIRKGEMISMEGKGDRMVCKFIIPSRGIIGLRNQLLTATAGEAIMTHRFLEYQPLKGGIPERQNGSLVSMETGTAIPYSIDKLQDRGRFFVHPNEDIYEGQVIGENSRQDDMTVNITKTKKLSNVRSSGADDKAKIIPAIKFSLEEALEYIQKDEYVEVTPNHLRIRKIYLKEVDRKRNKL